METSGTDILSDSESQAPVSPLHLAVSSGICQRACICLCHIQDSSVMSITFKHKRSVSVGVCLPLI